MTLYVGKEFRLYIKIYMYSLDGAANGRRSRAQNDHFIVPHGEVPGSNPGRGKQIKLFQGIL